LSSFGSTIMSVGMAATLSVVWKGLVLRWQSGTDAS
jgi:hypothetical protein